MTTLQPPAAPRRWRTSVLVLAGVCCLACVLLAAPAPAAQSPQEAHAAQPAHAAAAAEGHGEAKAEEHAEGSVLQTVAKLFNFALLVGILGYYLRAPVAGYLVSRSTQIRQELVTAAETRTTATAELAEIQRKLASLPAELEQLKAQGAEDVKAEKVRIAQAAAAERERLLEHTRREIETRLRVARRELMELAADLAVGVARQRITTSITPADQLRLVDRYAAQLTQQGSGPDAGAQEAR